MITGAESAGLIVRLKVTAVEPPALVAVMTTEKLPVTVGAPEIVAPLEEAADSVMPEGRPVAVKNEPVKGAPLKAGEKLKATFCLPVRFVLPANVGTFNAASIVICKGLLVVPPAFVALRETLYTPAEPAAGVPEIIPVPGAIVRPEGKPVAE